MMRHNIKAFALLLAVLVLILSLACCSKNDAKQGKTTLTPQPHQIEPNSVNSLEDGFGDNPAVTTQDMVAYYLSGSTLPTIYGAVEYANTGDCPLIVTSAKFIFDVDGVEITCEFEPPAARYCVVYPNETSYLCAWQDYTSELPPQSVRLKSTDIACEKATEERVFLTVDNPFVVQNYPEFASISGTIHGTINQPACALNMIYIAMYDVSGSLIGVWYFTEGSTIKSGASIDFTTHLRSLRIESLAESISNIKMLGYAFN